ncbi:MAG: RpnC/YadD family protein [Nostoc sp.]
MTQKFYSLFVEHYLEGLLSPLGSVEVSGVITGSERRGIVLFFPKGTIQTERYSLGLLAKVAQSDCSIEVYYEQIGETEVRSCLHKLLNVFSTLNCRASAEGKTLDDDNLPRLWILVPSASPDLLKGFSAQLELENWSTGIYFLPNVFRIAIVAINQLPVTSETLWLRLLGRGKVQIQAVSELVALPPENIIRRNVLEIVYRWRISVMTQTDLTLYDQELIMNLTEAYQEARAQAVQEGVEQGVQLERRQFVENLLRFRYGSVDEELSRIVNTLLQLSPDDLARFLLELSSLSHEDLLARFNSHQ